MWTSSIRDDPEGALGSYYGPKTSPFMGLNQPELFELIDKIPQTLNDEKRINLVEKAWGIVRADERHAHILENSSGGLA